MKSTALQVKEYILQELDKNTPPQTIINTLINKFNIEQGWAEYALKIYTKTHNNKKEH